MRSAFELATGGVAIGGECARAGADDACNVTDERGAQRAISGVARDDVPVVTLTAQTAQMQIMIMHSTDYARVTGDEEGGPARGACDGEERRPALSAGCGEDFVMTTTGHNRSSNGNAACTTNGTARPQVHEYCASEVSGVAASVPPDAPRCENAQLRVPNAQPGGSGLVVHPQQVPHLLASQQDAGRGDASSGEAAASSGEAEPTNKRRRKRSGRAHNKRNMERHRPQ